MAKGKEEVYSSLFDYIFSTKKAKGGNPIEGVNVSGLSGVGKGLAEMAAYPVIYPADKLISDFNFQVDLATNAKVEPSGVKLEAGAGSILGVLANPRKFVDKAWKDYQDGQKSARFSGRLKIIDGAKFALMGRKYGLEWGDAFALGSSVTESTGISYTDILNGKSRGESVDLSSRKSEVSERETGLGAGRLTEGSFSSLDRGLNAEFDAAIRKLESSSGFRFTASEKQSVRNTLKGYYKATSVYPDKTQRRSALNSLLNNNPLSIRGRTFSLSTNNVSSVVDGIWGIEETGTPNARLQRYQEDDLGFYNNLGKDTDPTARIRFASAKSQVKNLDSMIASATNPTVRNQLVGLRNVYINYISGRKTGLAYSLGTTIGQRMYMSKWIKDEFKGKLLGSLLTGTLFDFKNDIWKSGFADKFLKGEGYTKKIIDPTTGLDKEFKVSWLEGKRNASGKLTGFGRIAESYYYLHPINVVKGLFWDGRTWKKLTDLKWVSPKLAQRVISFMPAQLLQKYIKGPLQGAVTWISGAVSAPFRRLFASLAQKVVKDFSGKTVKELMAVPFRELVQQVFSKLLTQMLGSTIPFIGNVAALFADAAISLAWKMGEMVLKPLLQFMMLMVLGIFSTILILGSAGLGLFGKSTSAQPYQNQPVSYTSGQLVYGPVDFNFPAPGEGGGGDVEIPVYIPEDYDAGCPTPSGVICTAGPNWSGHATTKAVDLAFMGTIVAPGDGRITAATSSNSCSDGKDYGGRIVLVDNSGFTWTFIHTVNSVSVGDVVSAGTPLGFGKTNLQYSNCWSGPHLHISIKNPSGSYINAEDFFNQLGCNYNCP